MDTKTAIKQNLVYLESRITNLPDILSHLIQSNIISQREREEIEERGYIKLLEIMQRKDLPLNIFLEMLRLTHNSHCADKIQDFISKSVNEQPTASKILKNKWWPIKRFRTKSLHKRKIGDKFLVEELQERLLADENRMVVICESADASKLTGLGGVGKTLTATWYAYQYENQYDHVIWIDCGEGSLLKSFQKLARDLDVKHLDKLIDVEDYSLKSYEALEEFKCLWIFDNAESYRGKEGLKEVLPKLKNNFYCLITSRWRDWGAANVGYGNLSRLELSIFEETESLEFFKDYLTIQDYTEHQLKELSKLLGHLPLALQLAVATLNSGEMNLKNYIEATSFKDLENIVDATFDDYEKTINGNIKIALDLIGKEKNGNVANEILMILGYIRSDDIQSLFLMKIMNVDLNTLREAIDLLEKYSLISKSGAVKEIPFGDRIWDKILGRSNQTVEMDLLSIHRLLQQVIRHNGRNTENEMLRKIFECKGFLDFKLIPFVKYANNDLKKEFPNIKAEFLNEIQLKKLLNEQKFEESVHLAKYIDQEKNTTATKFNYALCLELNGQLEDNIKVLEELYYRQDIKEEGDIDFHFQLGQLNLKSTVTKELVGGHLLVSHWKMNNTERMQAMLQERKSFMVIDSQEMMTTCLRILNSNLIKSNYTLTHERPILKLLLDGDTKKIELTDLVYCSLRFPNVLHELHLSVPRFEPANEKYMIEMKNDWLDWLPKTLNTLKISCFEPFQFLISPLGSLSSIENISLEKCSLSLESHIRISPKQLKLLHVSFIKNGQKLSNVSVNDFIDLHKIKRLEIKCLKKKNLSIDLNEESANMEYLHLDGLTVVSLKSTNGNGRVNEAKIGNCSQENLPISKGSLISFLENITLENCSLNVDSGDRLSARKLKLENVSLFKNGQELSKVSINEFIDFQKMIRLEIKYSTEKDVSFDLSEESINMEYLFIKGVNVPSLKSINGKVNIKEARIEYCSLNLSTFPSFVENLSSNTLISSIENITLNKCSLSLDTVNRISAKKLKLERVSLFKNGLEIPNVFVNEFTDIHNMKRLELICDLDKNNLSIDLSEESADLEYLHLYRVTVLSLKSANGRVNIKEARIENYSLDLSILPPSLEKLSLSWRTKVLVSGAIDLPDLKYLELKGNSPLSPFRPLQLTHLYLKVVQEVNLDLLPPSIKTIRIDRGDNKTILTGGGVIPIPLDKLIFYGYPLTEVEEMLINFNPKQLHCYSYESYIPFHLIQLVATKIPTIAIGKVDWQKEDFENSIISKHVDRQSEYYVFHEDRGNAIEEKLFEELYLNDIFEK